MPEYRPFAAFTLCHHAACRGGADERSTTMYEALNQGLWTDRERTVAWVDRHGWQDAEVCRERRRKRREAVARVLRALAARLAPVEAGSVVEYSPLAVGQRG
jgi:hypothetical protein